MFQWQDSVEGEDCLRVNVWTPGINDNKMRPVMVWLHSGGFAAGSSHDTLMLDNVVKLVLNPDALELESIA